MEGSALVAIRAHFEKFPATVKGAFVLRSAEMRARGKEGEEP